MTYSEYREMFESVEEFMLAFGQLSYEEAHAMISAEDESVTIKACMITIWRQAKEKYEESQVP